MFRPLHSALLIAATLLGSQSIALRDACADSRVALVIGQSAYRSVTVLPNPANDAKMMSQLLSDAGFDVQTASDLTQNDMRAAISAFAAKIANTGPDTVALVFYAGHGLQIDGENYLVPVDVDPKRDADIPLQAVRLNDVLNTLSSVPNRMRILLLDACRNNPFPELNKSTGHGLAMVDAKTGTTGTFISYSTSPGLEAEDGSGIDSPYTTALLKAAREPGLPIEEALKHVRVAVNQETSGRQTPWDSSSLTDAFRFFPQQNQADAAAAPTPKRSVDDWKKQLKDKDIQAAYDLVVADDTVEGYEAFVALYTQPPLALRVRLVLDRRREMIAWQTAVLINTEAAYQAFLQTYPNSDLAATARKLAERTRNRSLNANAAAPGLINASLAGPTCPCGVQPIKATPTIKKVDDDDAPPKRSIGKPPKRVAEDPPPRRRRPPPVDDDVVYDARPAIPLVGGIGIGLGGGGFGRGGYGGGSYGGRSRY